MERELTLTLIHMLWNDLKATLLFALGVVILYRFAKGR